MKLFSSDNHYTTAPHIVTSLLICSSNEMNYFYMESGTGLKWPKYIEKPHYMEFYSGLLRYLFENYLASFPHTSFSTVSVRKGKTANIII